MTRSFRIEEGGQCKVPLTQRAQEIFLSRRCFARSTSLRRCGWCPQDRVANKRAARGCGWFPQSRDADQLFEEPVTERQACEQASFLGGFFLSSFQFRRHGCRFECLWSLMGNCDSFQFRQYKFLSFHCSLPFHVFIGFVMMHRPAGAVESPGPGRGSRKLRAGK